jgi:hypothetical protein
MAGTLPTLVPMFAKLQPQPTPGALRGGAACTEEGPLARAAPGGRYRAGGSERSDEDERYEKQESPEHRQPQRRRRLVGRERLLCGLVVVIVRRVLVVRGALVFLSTHATTLESQGGEVKGGLSTGACSDAEDRSKLGMLFA